MDKAYAIIGLQYGSEAKGALAGYLARMNEPDVVMANWSPNAGHTFRDGELKLVRRCLPIGTESPNCRFALLGPGAIIDPIILEEELKTIQGITVVIHPKAGIVLPRHSTTEKDMGYSEIGSTLKGAGAAAMERMTRDTVDPNIAMNHILATNQVIVDEGFYHDIINNASVVQIEGCQGYSLSMYNGFYPYTTSRDTTIHQLLADVAWHGALPVSTYGALRTYPIRVAGTSGPCHPDQRETSWDALGVAPEVTTVTKKTRRVFTFSEQQIAEAQQINACDEFYLSFCDYPPSSTHNLVDLLEVCGDILGKPVKWTSYGPDIGNMVETYG